MRSSAALLAEAAHRPYPLPRGPWIMWQTWEALLFAHWAVAPVALSPHLPPGLALDTYDGQAWVGVVPFTMSGIRPRGLPAVPVLSRSAEINLRTYVVAEDRPGVWFYSLDADNPLAVVLARALFSLPYYHARFSIQRDGATVAYASRRVDRRGSAAEFHARYRPIGPAQPAARGTLAHWLTERYFLYTVGRSGRLLRAEIHHHPWPLRPAEAEITRLTLPAAHGIALPDVPPLLHYAERQDVLVWPIRRVGP